MYPNWLPVLLVLLCPCARRDAGPRSREHRCCAVLAFRRRDRPAADPGRSSSSPFRSSDRPAVVDSLFGRRLAGHVDQAGRGVARRTLRPQNRTTGRWFIPRRRARQSTSPAPSVPSAVRCRTSTASSHRPARRGPSWTRRSVPAGLPRAETDHPALGSRLRGRPRPSVAVRDRACTESGTGPGRGRHQRRAGGPTSTPEVGRHRHLLPLTAGSHRGHASHASCRRHGLAGAGSRRGRQP